MRLEKSADGSGPLLLLGLALAPALVRPWWGRTLGALVAGLLAARVVFDRSPLDARPFDERDFFGPVAADFRDGVLGFYDVSLPFDPAQHTNMDAVVLTAIFGFALAVALALAARRPVVATTILLLASVWPVTLVGGNDLGRGALTLAVVLVLLALGGKRPTRAYRPALAAGAMLVVVAIGASTTEAVAKGAFVDWKTWDPYDVPADPVGVDYVWNANYNGITWPEEKTTVLTVEGPERGLYWRASTLDTFADNRWIEDLPTIGTSDEPVSVMDDPLFPQRGRANSRWLQARVTIEALRDDHLVGPSMPTVWNPREIGLVRYKTGGVAVVIGGLQRDDQYDMWAYAPRPKPAQLAAVKPNASLYGVASRYREVVDGVPVPAFGVPDREEVVERVFARYDRSLRAYRPLYRKALEIAGRPDSQYAAVLALEAWFRSDGGFVYDETPPIALGPPLVAFALGHQRGYCQLYAGAMALMLRYLGIPARVAVGFTHGSVDDSGRRWTVSDRDAHAWVEVWFRGWGWVPFDPTPARGQLPGQYSIGSSNFDVEGAQNALRGGDGNPFRSGLVDKLSERKAGEGFRGPDLPGRGGTFGTTVRERGASLLRLLVLVAAIAAAAVALTKLALRRARYLRRDPRGTASACRRELTDFLADQGIALHASATPRELAAEIERRFSVEAAPFATALAAARYAPPREARAAARRARAELRGLRRELRHAIGVPARVRGAVSLRSLAA
jgi:transglutaminase-like putative cysteine protease